MVTASTPDSVLWQSFKQGDRDAFAAIYHQYFRNLYEYGMRIADDKDMVKDSIHDLFVKLWSNKLNLGEISNVKSYLLVSLRGTIYNRFQRNDKVRTAEVDDNYNFEMTFSPEVQLLQKETLSEQTGKLLNAMNSLSPRQKEIIYLKYFEELDYDQIAEILQITTKATYKLSARALDALRQILNLPKSSLLILLVFARNEFFR